MNRMRIISVEFSFANNKDNLAVTILFSNDVIYTEWYGKLLLVLTGPAATAWIQLVSCNSLHMGGWRVIEYSIVYAALDIWSIVLDLISFENILTLKTAFRANDFFFHCTYIQFCQWCKLYSNFDLITLANFWFCDEIIYTNYNRKHINIYFLFLNEKVF